MWENQSAINQRRAATGHDYKIAQHLKLNLNSPSSHNSIQGLAWRGRSPTQTPRPAWSSTCRPGTSCGCTARHCWTSAKYRRCTARALDTVPCPASAWWSTGPSGSSQCQSSPGCEDAVIQIDVVEESWGVKVSQLTRRDQSKERRGCRGTRLLSTAEKKVHVQTERHDNFCPPALCFAPST